MRKTLKAVPGEDTSIRWYLRGDISRSHFNAPKSEYTVVFTSPNIGPIEYRNEMIRSAMGAAVGAGVRYRFARFDVTYEMRDRTPWLGYAPPFNDWAHPGPFPVPARRDHMYINARSIMANVYIDLGKWLGVNPYIGAGAGATRFTTSGAYTSEPLPLTAALGGLVETFSNGNNKTWSPSWALMAGFSIQFTDNIIIDAGYRYANLGALKYDHVNPATGQVFTNLKTADITSHDVRFGIRYEFGNQKTKLLPRNSFAKTSWASPG